MKSVLVTGGTGFLGSHVVDKLLEKCIFDQILVGTLSGRYIGPHSSVSTFLIDLLADIIVLPDQVDTIIHIAGEKIDLSLMTAVNHIGTLRLIEAAAKAQVRRFAYVSSVGVYGVRPHAGLVSESFPHTPQNLYETSKDAGEKSVHELCTRFGMEFVVVQPSNVIGVAPGLSYPLLGLMRMIKFSKFAWFGETEPWVNYVSVEDVATAIVSAAERAPSGQTFIINTPERLNDVVGWISEELGVDAPTCRLPLWVGQMAAGLCSAAETVSRRCMPFNREKFRELTNTTRYDGSALLQLGIFDYQGVQNMIHDLVKTYRLEGKL